MNLTFRLGDVISKSGVQRSPVWSHNNPVFSPGLSCWYWLLLIWNARWQYDDNMMTASLRVTNRTSTNTTMVVDLWWWVFRCKMDLLAPCKYVSYFSPSWLKGLKIGRNIWHNLSWPGYPDCPRRRPPIPSTSTCRQGRRWWWLWPPGDRGERETGETGLLSPSCLARLRPRQVRARPSMSTVPHTGKISVTTSPH